MCLNPTKAWYQLCESELARPEEERKKPITFHEEQSKYYRKWMPVPCGKCIQCKSKKLNEWGIRCTHEMSQHKHNSFITLTYRDGALPENESLNHRDFQLFIKRLRKHLGNHKVRYIMCGEYGKKSTKRPHYHLILFGYDFSNDRRLLRTRRSKGGRLVNDFISDTLTTLWPHGFHTIGVATYQTARYVAKYSLKTDETSEDERIPEYKVMSNGIGRAFAIKHAAQLGRDGFVWQHDSNRKQPIPKYYKQFLSEEHQEKLQQQAAIYIQTKEENTYLQEKASYLTQRNKCKFAGNVEAVEKLDAWYKPHLKARQECLDLFGVDIGPIDRPTTIELKKPPEHLVPDMDYPLGTQWRTHQFSYEAEEINETTGEIRNVPIQSSIIVCYSRY